MEANVILYEKNLFFAVIAIMIMAVQVKSQPFMQNQDLSDLLTDVYNGDVLWGDYDEDGDLDILITGSTLMGPVTELYKNEGLNFTALNLAFVSLENSDASWCDFDNDNDLDLLLLGTELAESKNLPKAILYENEDNDTFIQFETDLLGVYEGKSAWGDLDNDGDQDLIIIGDKGDVGITRIYKNNDGVEFELIDHNLSDIYNGDIVLGDYDNDMDLDILMIGVVVNTTGVEDKILKLYSNDGDFNFTGVYSEFIGMSESCVQWADYDSDGDLDILANGSTEAPTHLVYLYQNLNNDEFLNIGIEIFGTVNGSATWGDYDVDGDFDFLLTGMPSYGSDPITEIYRNINVNLFNKADSIDIIEIYHSQAKWCDYDKDGDLDVLMSGLSIQNSDLITAVYDNQNVASNTPPSMPSNLESVVMDNTVLLSWAKSSDNETPDAGLTYNLRIGSSPGQANILSPLAKQDGSLLTPILGNINHNKNWEIRDLSPGIYFWSVQAVDNNFEGSEFALEESFEIVVSNITDMELTVNSNRPLINSYPNPFSNIITFEIASAVDDYKSALILDMTGRIVRTLTNNRQIEKHLLLEWNGKNDQGELMPEGLYYFVFETEEVTEFCKVILVK